MPGADNIFDNSPFSPLLQSDYWSRIVRLDKKIEPSAVEFARRSCNGVEYSTSWISAKHAYLSGINRLTTYLRGEVFQRLGSYNIDIVGGDQAWTNKSPRNLKIQKHGLQYHKPLENYAEASNIYASSKINLNVTSLQFDNAVINRVIDVGASGGFILTDWKADLRKITTVHNEISYRSIDELNNKIEYYLVKENERCEIAKQFEHDIKSKCSYHDTWEYILSKLNNTSGSAGAPVRLDIGCGPRKKEGFIGVDFDGSWPGVDVAADLTMRFPYPDNSVDEIRAHDIIEHLPDRIHTMNEIWRICKHKAKIDINVPSTDGRGAFQDPTHISFWNVNSFKYYSSRFPAYHELCKSYGFKGDFRIDNISQMKSIDAVIHVNAQLTVIKSQN